MHTHTCTPMHTPHMHTCTHTHLHTHTTHTHMCTHAYTALRGKFKNKCKFKAADHQIQRRNSTVTRNNKRGTGAGKDKGQETPCEQD